MKRHRILHIRDSSGIFGSERVIMTLGKNLNPDLFDLSLLCMRRNDGRSEPLIGLARSMGVEVEPVDVKGRIDLKAVVRIRQFIQSHNVSLIHTHDFKSDFYGLLATWKLGVRRVATAHGSTRDSLLKKLYLYADENAVYRLYDKIIAVSEGIHTELSGKSEMRGRVELIQNGLDAGLLNAHGNGSDPPLPVSKSPGKTIFAVVGRLFPDKGHKVFLHAFAGLASEAPGSFGIIAGDGPEKESILRAVHTLGIRGKMFYCGVRKNIKDLYRNIDCLVIPSFTEGLPYVMLEAMSCGIPVIATSVGDIPLLIQDNITGYLIPPGDVGALTLRMRDIASRPEHARAMADEGRNLVNRKFSAGLMVKKTEALYLSLLS